MRLLALSLFVAGLLVPRTALAQWHVDVYLGANHTQSASVTVDQPARGRAFTFDGVTFEARPFESPQYYGWRVGRQMGSSRRFGVELEFIHLKVIGQTDRAYAVSGLDDAGGQVAMNTVVQRYAMTHGLNFALVNVAMRTVLRDRVSVTWRAGAGVTVPHAETTIDGERRDQYEYGGPGAQLAAAIGVRTWRFVSTMAEYKFTIARPRIDVAGGTGAMTAATHQIAFGLAFDVAR